METQKETKNNGTTEVVFILDRSGSMSGLEKDTIGGFNSMIEKQKNETADAVVTTVLFDTEFDTIHDRVKLGSVPELTEKEYFARGCTALLDAVGLTIQRVSKLQADGIKPTKTLFVITTDGLENSSREYTYQSVKELIESKKKEEGWEFIFMGANIDAIGEAAKMGISANRAATFYNDDEGIKRNFEAAGCVMHNCCKMEKIDECWADDIIEYREMKTKKKNA